MKYPNLDLYGNLKACEDNLLEMINSNFFKLDSSWMVRAIDLVSELPSIASFGDIYILESGIYEHTYSIEIFDGVSWQSIEVKNGMHFWIESEKDFFYLNDGLHGFTDRYGNVKGPGVSMNNSVAIFDGESGNFITDSGFTIKDNTLSGESIYSDSIYSESIYSEVIETYDLNIKNSITVASIDFDGQGEDAEIPDEDGVQFILTNNNLISISKINKTQGSLLTILNITGGSVVIKNGNGIFTGTERDIDLNNEASILLQRFGSDWFIVGGTGSGSGGGVSPWEAFTYYKAGNQVIANNGIYVCNTDHNSINTFLDDIAYWDVLLSNNVEVKAVLADRTIEVTDDVLLVDCGSFGANITLTLPLASTCQKILTIKRIDNLDQYTVTVARSGTDLIDGQTSFLIYRQYDSIRLVGTSTIWSII